MKTRHYKIIRRRAPNYWAVKITRYFNYSHSSWQVCGFPGGLEEGGLCHSWNRYARLGSPEDQIQDLLLGNFISKQQRAQLQHFIWFYWLQGESDSRLSLLVPSWPRRMFMKCREMCKIIKTNNDYTTQASYWIRGSLVTCNPCSAQCWFISSLLTSRVVSWCWCFDALSPGDAMIGMAGMAGHSVASWK